MGMGAGSENPARSRPQRFCSGWKCRGRGAGELPPCWGFPDVSSSPQPLPPCGHTESWFGEFTAPNSAPVGGTGGSEQCSALNYSRIHPSSPFQGFLLNPSVTKSHRGQTPIPQVRVPSAQLENSISIFPPPFPQILPGPAVMDGRMKEC